MPARRPSDLVLVLILGALTTVSPFAIDMYLPAFGQLATELRVTPAMVSYSLSSYFLGMALGPVVYGPLLDRFGRKKPLVAGLTLFALASIGCMRAAQVETLIMLRFVQALGGCAASVAATAMVRDFFPVKDSARIFSLLILILGVSPLFAPTVGGFVSGWLGWQGVFAVLAAVVLGILLVAVLVLPEGHVPDKSISLKPGPILRTFADVLRVPQFTTYALSCAFSFTALFVYVAGSPILFMQVFSVSPRMYGGIFALLSVGFIGGSQLNHRLVKRYGSARIFHAALVGQSIVGAVFLLGTMAGVLGLFGTLGVLLCLLVCLGVGCPNASALAMAPFEKHAGSASALLSLLQIGIAGIVSTGIGLLDAHSALPIVALMAGGGWVALGVLMVGERVIARHPRRLSASVAS